MEGVCIPNILKENAALVEQALAERAHSFDFLSPLYEDAALQTLARAEDYSLMAGGKRIRPVLVLQVCHALGGDVRAALPFACAVEMIHTYSLIHDDLPSMDNDDLRRGKPTSHKVFGEATAILAGDGLLSDAFGVVASAERLSDTARLVAVRLLSEAVGSVGMVGGQLMDMEGEQTTLSMGSLVSLHARKTGALIRASVLLGAIAAGVTAQTAVWQALTLYAQRIGLAFQVVDDILDVTADAALLGKTKGKDSAEHKTTFLTYYTVDEARQYVKRLTDEACAAVKPHDRYGVLEALALYLAERAY